MIRKLTGICMIMFGDVVLFIALMADYLGLGAAPQAVGYKQISLAVVAVIIQLVGIVLSQMEVKKKGIIP
jgi:hypothetical protein